MTFKRARTEDQIHTRQEEIKRACRQLFLESGYEGVHFKAISDITSFTRPTIYNYYKTKDDILLDLLMEEMADWTLELSQIVNKWMASSGGVSSDTKAVEFEDLNLVESRRLAGQKDYFARVVSTSLGEKTLLLKLLAILFTTLEHHCSMDKLTEFKGAVMALQGTLIGLLQVMLKTDKAQELALVTTILFAMAQGLYPMSQLTYRQEEAIKMAGVAYVAPDFSSTLYGVIKAQLNLIQ